MNAIINSFFYKNIRKKVNEGTKIGENVSQIETNELAN